MLLLAIDTATSAITVALHDGERVLAESNTLDARGHGEYLAPGIVEVLTRAGLATADVSAVVVGTGPGPFTGLRVGLVTAQTFAFARGIPVFGVCSLDAMAHQAWLEDVAGELGQSCVVATDARRKEVYWATLRSLWSRGEAHRGADGRKGGCDRRWGAGCARDRSRCRPVCRVARPACGSPRCQRGRTR